MQWTVGYFDERVQYKLIPGLRINTVYAVCELQGK